MSEERRFIVAPGPHVHVGASTASLMWWVNAAAGPAAAWGVYLFGMKALWVILASVAGAVAGEWLAGRAMKVHHSISDGSAVCTGLLLALTLPPLVPPAGAALGGLFAVVFGKMLFGGLGYNLFNPAMVGRAFLLATFPVVMTTGWVWPRAGLGPPLHALSTPTPLVVLREQGAAQAMRLLSGPGGPWVNLIMGFRPGSIGEVSALLLGLGAIVLMLRDVIRPTIPLSVFAGVALVTSVSGASALHLLSGGLWLGAFFMATDYVTSPKTRDGQIVFGLVVGLLTGLIRVYGGYPEGICYAILVANTMTPAINMWFRPRRTMPAGVPS